jgi:aspartyl/asparaginyl beta-hydroxylase (cupin superfamily)
MPSHPSPATPEFDALVAQARRSTESGRPDEVLAAWQRVRAADPANGEALFHLGRLALAGGDAAQAQALLEQAVAREPRSAIAHATLARAHLQQGRTQAALAALEAATRADPLAWGAHFEKGGLLEQLGRTREASLAWQMALDTMPAEAAGLPHIAPVVARARQAVVAGRTALRDFIADRVAPLRADARGAEQRRYEHCLDILAGRRRFLAARPTMFAYPRLPAIPFFEREEFDWAPAVEAAWMDIRAELEAVLADDAGGIEPYVQTRPGELVGQFEALDHNPDWGAYFLWQHGRRIDAHCERCPRTEAVLRNAPQVQVRERAPVAFFSLLKPGTWIPPHNGATNTRLTVHLPLIVPPDCAIRVGDEVRQWTPGQLLAFDDTIEHEAWNRSDRLRAVLIFDVWHPMLSPLERELVAETIEGIMAWYGRDADLGEL